MRRISSAQKWLQRASLAFALAAWWLIAVPARAQSAPDAEAAKPAATAPDEGFGTTIVGDRETPLGLYLTPWKNLHPDRSLDRPPQLLQEELTPIDPDVFHRRVQYYDYLAEQRKLELGGGK
jgi:hypothetical protein